MVNSCPTGADGRPCAQLQRSGRACLPAVCAQAATVCAGRVSRLTGWRRESTSLLFLLSAGSAARRTPRRHPSTTERQSRAALTRAAPSWRLALVSGQATRRELTLQQDARYGEHPAGQDRFASPCTCCSGNAHQLDRLGRGRNARYGSPTERGSRLAQRTTSKAVPGSSATPSPFQERTWRRRGRNPKSQPLLENCTEH